MNPLKFENHLQYAFFIFMISGYVFIFHAALTTFQTLVQKEATLKLTFKEQHQLAVSLPIYQKQVDELIKRLDFFRPKNQKNNLSAVLELLTKTGIQAGLSFESIQADQESSLNTTREQSIDLLAWGDYPSFIHFMQRMMQQTSLLKWQDFEMKQKNDLLEIRMHLTWYRE